MTWCQDAINSLFSILKTTELVDVFDILVLSYLVYWVIKLVRETRAGQLMKGIVLLFIAYIIAKFLQMKVVSYLMEQAFSIGVIALMIMFQPELRRALEKVGNSKWGLSLGLSMPTGDAAVWGTAIEAICDACVELSATATGALIVVERQTRLGEQIDNGTILNATPSKELFGNIFYPKTPLHDGAVIMRDGMILAAACFLPKPQKEELVNKKLGSRHRAAIGMSENSDAIVIVVSEETGSISVAENGLLKSGFTREQLKQLLTDRLIQKDTDSAIRKAARKIPFIKSKRRKSSHEDSKESRKKTVSLIFLSVQYPYGNDDFFDYHGNFSLVCDFHQLVSDHTPYHLSHSLDGGYYGNGSGTQWIQCH